MKKYFYCLLPSLLFFLCSSNAMEVSPTDNWLYVSELPKRNSDTSLFELPESPAFFDNASLEELERALSYWQLSKDGSRIGYNRFSFAEQVKADWKNVSEKSIVSEKTQRIKAKIYFFNQTAIPGYIIPALHQNNLEEFNKTINHLITINEFFNQLKQDNIYYYLCLEPLEKNIAQNLTNSVLKYNTTPNASKFLAFLHEHKQLAFNNTNDHVLTSEIRLLLKNPYAIEYLQKLQTESQQSQLPESIALLPLRKEELSLLALKYIQYKNRIYDDKDKNWQCATNRKKVSQFIHGPHLKDAIALISSFRIKTFPGAIKSKEPWPLYLKYQEIEQILEQRLALEY